MEKHPPSSNALLEGALKLAKRHWLVFPLAPNSKVPLRGTHGFMEASCDELKIRYWWRQNPNANVGLRTGQSNRIVVLDIDPRHGGDASLDELERLFGCYVETVQVDTGGSGWHLYFEHPGCDLKANLGSDFPGIDVKTDGGYVVVPPSVHPSGVPYKWKLSPEDTEIAEMPPWLLRFARGEPRPPLRCEDGVCEVVYTTGPRDDGAPAPSRRRGDEAPASSAPRGHEAPASSPSDGGAHPPREAPRLLPGERHIGLVRIAGRMVNAGLSIAELRVSLHAINRDRCDPPLDDREIGNIIKSAEQWDVANAEASPTARAGYFGGTAASYSAPPDDASREEGLQGGYTGTPSGPDDLPSPIRGGELKQMVRSTTWTWPGWVAEGHITVLAGESGAGKSWFALALAKAAALGLPWPDQQAGPDGEALVFWLETEGRHAVLLERAEKMGVDPDFLVFMPQPLRTYHIDDLADFAVLSLVVEQVRPRLIVVDSWSKALAGKENDADVRFALDSLQALARSGEAPVVLVHHLRKRQVTDYTDGFDFDRLRGSSVLAQSAACLIGIDQPDRRAPVRRVSCGKASLSPLPEPFGFEISDLGLAFGPAPEPDQRQSKLEEAKAFLQEALADGPRPASEVMEEGRDEGFTERTLRRAKRELCDYHREGGQRPVWMWSLKQATQD
jgi:hypothetical protein